MRSSKNSKKQTEDMLLRVIRVAEMLIAEDDAPHTAKEHSSSLLRYGGAISTEKGTS